MADHLAQDLDTIRRKLLHIMGADGVDPAVVVAACRELRIVSQDMARPAGPAPLNGSVRRARVY